jgi:hypothetical protein
VWFEPSKVEWVLGREGHGLEWERVFRVNADGWEHVWRSIANSIVTATIKDVRDRLTFGIVCGVEVSLVVNGRTAPVKLGWHYVDEYSLPRLVTAYPIP